MYRDALRALTDMLTDSFSNVLLGEKLPLDVLNAETEKVIIPANHKITKAMLRELAIARNHIGIGPSPIRNRIREIIGSYEPEFAALELQYSQLMENTSSHQLITSSEQFG
jgi:DNA-directed RNA polymerase subunit beta